MIITATEMTVAVIESLMINRENDFCWLKAIRRAMKEDMFNIENYDFAALPPIPKSLLMRLFTSTKSKQQVLNSLFLNFMKLSAAFLVVFFLFGCKTRAVSQTGRADADIRSVKLYRGGDQASFPVIGLNSGDVLQLDFDDLSGNIRNYYYTYELCNADWSPSILRPFEYIKGFQNNRITTYRNSSLTSTAYVHYQATLPDRNCYPSRSGNYLLKVFVDNDTSKVVFTRRFIVADNKANVGAQVQQPFNASLFRSGQKLQISLQTDNRIQALSPNDLKVVVLQNNNWETSLYMDRPTIFRGNYYEYSDEALTGMLAGKEFRWLDMRSLRLKSDRMQRIENRDSVSIYVKNEGPRNGEGYIYYRDLNGSYTIEAMESINPFWQGDYAYVHFSYLPSNNRPLEGNDVYIFGELTNYATDNSGKMDFNEQTGAYEKTLFLKQGFYNYLYATRPAGQRGPLDFSQTEGNYWGTENSYIVLVYYRSFGSRADEVIGFASLNSVFQRTGL
jgi:hypothetical protein